MAQLEIALPQNSPLDPNVAERVHQLMMEGAVVVDPLLNCASPGQVDLLFQDRRLLVGPNDEQYRYYNQTLATANIPHITNGDLGDEQVYVGEVPQDGRTVPQVSFSRQSSRGKTVRDVLFEAGQHIHVLAAAQGLVPDGASFSLRRIMARRLTSEVLLLPPLDFTRADHQSAGEVLTKIQTELWPTYEHFGAQNLFAAFKEGAGL